MRNWTKKRVYWAAVAVIAFGAAAFLGTRSMHHGAPAPVAQGQSGVLEGCGGRVVAFAQDENELRDLYLKLPGARRVAYRNPVLVPTGGRVRVLGRRQFREGAATLTAVRVQVVGGERSGTIGWVNSELVAF